MRASHSYQCVHRTLIKACIALTLSKRLYKNHNKSNKHTTRQGNVDYQWLKFELSLFRVTRVD